MAFVTLSEAKLHCRVDNDADDPWFEDMIPAIEESIQMWLKDSWRPYVLVLDSAGDVALDSSGAPIVMTDSSGDPIPQPVVKSATLVELAQQYRFRDGNDAPAVPAHWGHGYSLGIGATSLLGPLRKSTVA